ncbi:Receptor expression-enhancing protein 5 [Trichinella nativa]|uniref:Receptor expression-enhancing protein 5 n=1 Tax=Trichinella nativa TaxID=6335 RepID=A0A0V1LRZ8_9BILA|nr:Receptor expression-enhancing protein 5 [Trichinella nativa]
MSVILKQHEYLRFRDVSWTRGTSAEVLCNLCFYYPAMKTIMEIAVEEKLNFNQWLFYWVTFGLFAIVFFWLFMPSCRGAEKLNEKLVKLCCVQHPTDDHTGNKTADKE